MRSLRPSSYVTVNASSVWARSAPSSNSIV